MVTDKLTELQERREKLGELIRSMVAEKKAEDWDAETENKFAETNAAYDETVAAMEEEQRSVDRAGVLAKIEQDDQRESFAWQTEKRAATMERLTGKPRITPELRRMALAAFFNPGNVSPEHRAACQALGINYAAPELNFRGLFQDAPKSIREAREMRKELEIRQQGTTPDSAGGYTTLPVAMLMEIEIALLQFGVIRGTSDVTRTATGEAVGWPTTNDTGNLGAIVAENAEHTQLDIVVGQVLTKPFTYSSRVVLVSLQLLQDSHTNWPALVGRLLGERIGRIQADHFTVGAGTTEPRGITLDAADSGLTLAASNAPSHAELIQLKHSVDPAYRRDATSGYMFHDTVLANIKQLADSAGQPIWKAGVAPGAPDTIDGSPYFINQSMPTGASSKNMLYGQLNKYKIHDATGITLRRTDQRYWEYLQVGFLAHMRSDGRLLDAGTGPVKYATNAA